MMKIINKNGLILILITLILIFSQTTQAEAGKGLLEGRLASCPDKPNCVSTESNDLEAITITPFAADKAWNYLKLTLIELGGVIKQSDSDYFWATFETPLMKFIDDVEARLDTQNNLIHLRSASRLGYYDFNTNKNRLQRIVTLVNRKLIADKMINQGE